MHFVPTSTAAILLLRQHPNLLGERLKRCFLTGDSSSMRELLVPGDPMPVEAQRDSAGSEDTWDTTCSNSRSQMPEYDKLGGYELEWVRHA